jgi:hypothetical protein
MRFLNDRQKGKFNQPKKQIRKQRTIDGIKFVAVLRKQTNDCYVKFPAYDEGEFNRVYKRTTDLNAAIQEVYEDVVCSFYEIENGY